MTNASGFTKSERRLLREAAGYAWEAELGVELMKLLQEFHSWREGRLNVFELSDRIHRFHDGAARELYGRYTSDQAVPWITVRAVALGLVSEDRLGASLTTKLAHEIEEFKLNRLRKAEEADEG